MAPPETTAPEPRQEIADADIRLGRVRVVLVEPLYDGNVGATARAMQVMGLSRLMLVDPAADHLSNEARQMACNAREILESATIVDSLETALAGVAVALGTSARHRSANARRVEPIDAALAAFVQQLRGGEGALVFGREDKGLFDSEITQCQIWGTIPTVLEHGSLNLAQAVQVVTYELARQLGATSATAPLDLATRDDMEQLFDRIMQVLATTEFTPRGGPELFRNSLRRAFSRAQMELRDVRVLHRVCAQVEWFAHVRAGKPRPEHWHIRKPRHDEEDG